MPRVGSCRVLGDSGGPGPEVDAYLGSSWGAKREPKGTQNESQNDPKAIIKSSSTSMALLKITAQLKLKIFIKISAFKRKTKEKRNKTKEIKIISY